MLDLRKFLNPDLVVRKPLAVRGYSEAFDFEDKDKLIGYKIMISIDDDESPFFMETFELKIKNLNPTIPVDVMAKNRLMPVIIKDFRMGSSNDKLWFNCSDILPVEKSVPVEEPKQVQVKKAE